MSSACAASAAEAAAKHKEEKYIEIACNHLFFPSPLRRSVLLTRSAQFSDQPRRT